MITQRAQAHWQGGLKDGAGSFRAGSVAGRYSYSSRFEGGSGSTPEELIGAAHAGCFSMALALVLGEHGLTPVTIDTTATVYLDPDRLAIRRIELETKPRFPPSRIPCSSRVPKRPRRTARSRRPCRASRSCLNPRS